MEATVALGSMHFNKYDRKWMCGLGVHCRVGSLSDISEIKRNWLFVIIYKNRIIYCV
jgi:hypothetical protein